MVLTTLAVVLRISQAALGQQIILHSLSATDNWLTGNARPLRLFDPKCIGAVRFKGLSISATKHLSST